AMGENAIEVEVFVAAALVIALESLQLPGFTADPRGDPALDGAEVGSDQLVPVGRAQRRALQLADDLEQIAEAREFGVVAGNERVDQRGGIFSIVTRQPVQLRAGTGPAPRAGAVIAQRATNTLLARVRIC